MFQAGYETIGDNAFIHNFPTGIFWYHARVDERNPASDTRGQLTGTEFGSG